ncbi:MAG TPA: SH3 domain-containing C40 family peptidase [Gemmatimonadaceae bacterium]|nr:SH3 domain-containing C40 family peptidase [Gemmatimonadaceae bacterium]
MSDRYLVRVAIAPLHSEPRAAAEQVSQRVRGHVVMLLEEHAPWLRVRGADGYEGWIHSGYLQPLTAALEMRFEGARHSLGCTVRDAHGHRLALPLGALLAGDDVVEKGSVIAASELRTRFPATPASITCAAVELFESTPYQWGGITPWGADCSGLVQTVFGLHGISMPRDARDQANVAREVGDAIGDARPADLLFFSDRPDRRITHVAIALDGMRAVHLAIGRGGYAVEQLDAHDDPYVSALVGRFLYLRRPELSAR